MHCTSVSQCCWLTADQANRYSHLTTKSLALALTSIDDPYVAPCSRTTLLFAAGDTFAGMPAALAIVKQTESSEWEVLSLAVSKLYRRLGLATHLFDWLRHEAIHRGISSMSVSCPLDHPSTAAMTRLIDPQKGWHLSEGLRMVQFDRAGGLILLEKLAPLSARWLGSGQLTVVRWQDLSMNQLSQIQLLESHAPQWASPAEQSTTPFAEQRDKTSSNVLLDQGEVIGWLIADRVGVSLIRVTTWWVIQRWQGTGSSLVMLHQAIADLLAAQPLCKTVCFVISNYNEVMSRLCSRHLEPLACRVQYNQRGSLKLKLDELACFVQPEPSA